MGLSKTYASIETFKGGYCTEEALCPVSPLAVCPTLLHYVASLCLKLRIEIASVVLPRPRSPQASVSVDRENGTSG